MAISSCTYRLLRAVNTAGLFAFGSPLLEIGEANWYDPSDFSPIMADLAEFAIPSLGAAERLEKIAGSLKRALAIDEEKARLFAVAKVVYDLLIWPSYTVAIDMHGTPEAIKHDLNEPRDYMGQFGTVINNGTAEHVFNLPAVLQTMHDACGLNGMMIHECPLTGWFDHGFYNVQPGLFFDLAAANNYALRVMAVEDLSTGGVEVIYSRQQLLDMARERQLPENSLLFVGLQKRKPEPFKVPMQAHYAGNGTGAVSEAWKAMR